MGGVGLVMGGCVKLCLLFFNLSMNELGLSWMEMCIFVVVVCFMVLLSVFLNVRKRLWWIFVVSG